MRGPKFLLPHPGDIKYIKETVPTSKVNVPFRSSAKYVSPKVNVNV